MRPNDKDARAKFNECKKIVQMQAFQKAIAVEENHKSVADSIDLASMSKRGSEGFHVAPCHVLFDDTFKKIVCLPSPGSIFKLWV